jgi:hypothetical protein
MSEPSKEDIDIASHGIEWLRDKLIESNSEAITWKKVATDLAKKITPMGYEDLLKHTKARLS